MRYCDRKKIFDSKKKLKGKKIAITESLTVARIKKLNEARERYNFKNGWTSDRKLLYKDGKKLRYIMVNKIYWLTDMCYIAKEKTGFFIVVVLFALGVIFIWGNFTSWFFSI